MTKRRLGVNIDHIATLRQARGVSYPDPFQALDILVACKVDQVTIHLREDRRHILDRDLERITASKALPVNLEMAVTEEMVGLALKHKPETVTFVPEKREELTTEGGLDCVRNLDRIKFAVKRLSDSGVRCALFIDPDRDQVEASKEIGVHGVEFHTGTFCNVIEEAYEKSGSYEYTNDEVLKTNVEGELKVLSASCHLAKEIGIQCFAGHGLHINNLKPVTEINEIEEYNIGHAIIARSVFVGLEKAIQEIQEILR